MNVLESIPQAEQIEAVALGCLLLAGETDAKQQREMLAKLPRRLFHDLRHAETLTSIRSLLTAGQSAGVVNVAQWLRDKGRLENAGGLPYVSNLPNLAPAASALDNHLPTLRDKAARRDLLRMVDDARTIASDETRDLRDASREFVDYFARTVEVSMETAKLFEFLSPAYLRAWTPPANAVLVGNNHILRGEIAVLAGAPGVGKSRAATALAIAGATLQPWFGLAVHHQFKTAIIQAENGEFRLKDEFSAVPPEADDFIRVTPPPPRGLAFDCPEFTTALREWLEEFGANLLILDPWNNAARDDGQRDYAAVFDGIRAALPAHNPPAVLIVAHTRKPKADDKRRGRSLMHEIAGSHLLVSRPRSAFVLLAASDDSEDTRVVFECAKNNNGPLGARSAWHRRNGLFAPCGDFDWQAYDSAAPTKAEGKVSEAKLEALFQDGQRWLAKNMAVKELRELAGCGQSAAYDALDPEGRFALRLTLNADGLLGLKP